MWGLTRQQVVERGVAGLGRGCGRHPGERVAMGREDKAHWGLKERGVREGNLTGSGAILQGHLYFSDSS